MSRPVARFEVCRGDGEWWARYRAANSRIVFVTETYQDRKSAINAIASISALFYARVADDHRSVITGRKPIEVREIDERTAP